MLNRTAGVHCAPRLSLAARMRQLLRQPAATAAYGAVWLRVLTHVDAAIEAKMQITTYETNR